MSGSKAKRLELLAIETLAITMCANDYHTPGCTPSTWMELDPDDRKTYRKWARALSNPLRNDPEREYDDDR